MKKTIWLIIWNILFLICFVYVWWKYDASKEEDIKYEVRENNTQYSFINPILECNIELDYYNYHPLQEKIEDYIDSKISSSDVLDISYYVRILNSGATFGYHENSSFLPASLLKLPIAMWLANRVGISNLKEKEVLLEEATYITPRNIGQDRVQPWNTYSYYELLTAMLQDSDNTATDILVNYLGIHQIHDIYDKFSLGKININFEETLRISPKKYATFFRILYNSSYLSRKDSEELLSIMLDSKFTEWIRYYIPEDIRIVNKFWERTTGIGWDQYLHDCGIIYLPENPYLVCIMTKWKNLQNLLPIVQDISRLIYTDISNQSF